MKLQQKVKNFIAALVFLSIGNLGFTQCAYLNNGTTTFTPACTGSPEVASGCLTGGDYVTINVIAGNTYTFTTCGGAGWDTQLTLFPVGGGASLGYNDDNCGLQSTITWVATFTGSVELQVNQYPCSTNGLCSTISVTCSGGGGGGGGPANDDPCNATPLTVNGACAFTGATNAGATATAGVPAPGCASYSGGDVWFTVTVPASGSVTVETGAGVITDGGMAVYSGTCGSLNLISCDDDGGAGLMSLISLVGQTPGATLWVRVWEYGNNNNGTFNICAHDAGGGGGGGAPTNVTCSVPNPICSGTPIQFTAQANGTSASIVNPGNNYDCLFTSPNPSWYYLEISSGGNLVIDITAGSDIDYEIWGPFPSLANAVGNCDSYGIPQDCSYSASPIEQAVVNGVSATEVYVLLVTNYANTVQMITIVEAAANSATTNCAIVLPIELVLFNGERIDDEVALDWRTASETNNDYFVVERSADAKVWSAFEVVDGAGTSASATDYRIIDSNPFNGTNYYRLKQFDFNGKVTIADLISVSDQSINGISMFPNPSKDLVNVVSSKPFTNISVIDIRGNVVKSTDYDNKKFDMLDVKDIKGGVYFVHIRTASGVKIERLVVQ